MKMEWPHWPQGACREVKSQVLKERPGGQQMPWEFAWRKSVNWTTRGEPVTRRQNLKEEQITGEVIMKAGGVRTKILLGVNRGARVRRHTGGGCKAEKVKWGITSLSTQG